MPTCVHHFDNSRNPFLINSIYPLNPFSLAVHCPQALNPFVRAPFPAITLFCGTPFASTLSISFTTLWGRRPNPTTCHWLVHSTLPLLQPLRATFRKLILFTACRWPFGDPGDGHGNSCCFSNSFMGDSWECLLRTGADREYATQVLFC